VLERAQALFELVAAGWCRDARPFPGGVYWVDAGWNRDRGAAVTAGLAVLALHLHELAGTESGPDAERARAGYLDTALVAYRWLRDALWIADGSDMAGLYHDKVLGDGAIDASQWIYNQGVAIAAGVMLHRVTGERRYLEQAQETAEAALIWYGSRGFAGQPAIFVAIFFRNLLTLAALTGTSAYRAAMLAYADRAWDDPVAHDARTDLFHFEGPGSACTLLDQAAMVQLYALAAWPAEQYGLLA
jgi:hypothetical protein